MERENRKQYGYRTDFSPKCMNCEWYEFNEDFCINEEDDQTLAYPSCDLFKQRTDIYCNTCGKPYEEGIDEDIMERGDVSEFWGAMVQHPDNFIGYICAFCGEEIEL